MNCRIAAFDVFFKQKYKKVFVDFITLLFLFVAIYNRICRVIYCVLFEFILVFNFLLDRLNVSWLFIPFYVR